MSGYVKAKYSGSSGVLQGALAKRLSGESLKARRMEFALRADIIGREKSQGRSIMLTRPISTKTVPVDAVWSSLDKSWTALHSTKPGSLYDILCTLHARRFRLFPKVGARQAFMAQATIEGLGIDRQFNECGLLDVAPKLTAAALYDALTMQVRGKGEETSEEPLLKRFVMTFGTKPLPKEGDLTLPIHLCFQDLAGELVRSFKTWPEMREGVEQSLAITESVLSRHGFEVKGLERLPKCFVHDNASEALLAKSTFQYDHSRPLIETTDPTLRLYLICASYAAEAFACDAEPAKYAQEAITTINANGLSWLFNDGITLLQESPAEQLALELGVDWSAPDQRADLEALIAAVRQFVPPAAFGRAAAKSARTALQGGFDSMIAIHLKRLNELHEALEVELDPKHQAPLSASYKNSFSGVEVGLDEYNTLLAQLDDQRKSALHAIGALSGHSPVDPSRILEHVAAFNQYRDLLGMLRGTLEKVINNCEIAQLSGTSEIKAPDKNPALAAPDALVVIHDRLIDPSEDRAFQEATYTSLKASYNALIGHLTLRYELGYARTKEERTRFMEGLKKEGTNRLAWATPEILAVREILSKLTHAVFRCTGSNVRQAYLDQVIALGIIPSNPVSSQVLDAVPQKSAKRDWTKLINENKGTLFVNPKDRARKYIVPCDHERLLSTDLFALVDALLALDGLLPRDAAILEQQRQAMLLQGLPPLVPSSDLDDYVRVNCQPNIRPLLREELVARQNVIKAITSSYQATLSGLLFKLNKTRFTDTRAFAVWEAPVLAYVPKAAVWNVPATYHAGILADAIDTYGVMTDGGLDAMATAKAVIKALNKPGEEGAERQARDLLLKKLLLQLPHEWGVVLDINGWGEDRYAYLIDGGTAKTQCVVPLAVPVAFSKDIDRVLLSEKSSPPRVVFERSYVVDNGRVRELIDARRCTVNIPITLSGTPEGNPWQPEYLLGIDPGEFGLGFGLIDLDGNEIDRCFVSVPVLRAFRAEIQSHRQKFQPRQKYRTPYSTQIEQMKEAATGEMTSIIETLMYKLNAFPILEMPDARATDKIAQLTEKLLQNFCWGDNDAQNSARVSHWYGGNRWTTPWINQATDEPVKAYPGAKVGSFGNSQQCPNCRRNPIQHLRHMIENEGCKSLTINEAGQLPLSNGTVRIHRMDLATYEHNLRRNRQPDYAPAGAQQFDKLSLTSPAYKDLRTLLINSLWRANPDRNAKQSRQSVYHCLYTDCRHTCNSEAGAGINIARKYLDRLKKPDAAGEAKEKAA